MKVVRPKRTHTTSILLNAKVVCSFGVVVVLIWLMIYNQVKLNEVSGQINSLTTELTRLESEHTRMLSSLESTVSLRTIGDKAKNELGMNRLDQYQTVHIMLDAEDTIEFSGEKKSEDTGGLKGIISGIQEYIDEK